MFVTFYDQILLSTLQSWIPKEQNLTEQETKIPSSILKNIPNIAVMITTLIQNGVNPQPAFQQLIPLIPLVSESHLHSFEIALSQARKEEIVNCLIELLADQTFEWPEKIKQKLQNEMTSLRLIRI